METETVGQLWPLKSGSTNQPTLTPGTQTTFQFTDVPDRPPSGPLAYYLPGVKLTFSGNVVQSGSTGSTIYSDAFFAALFASLGWIQCWQGTALRTSDILGAHWQVTEYMAGGRRYDSAVRGTIANANNGTYPFEVTIFVPFLSDRRTSLEAETSQLALLARASQLQINVAPTTALTNLSTGASLTSFKATASAILVPRGELILGTPIENILTQVVAGSGNSVTIQNFGVDTGLTGVDPGGGVLDLLFLTNELAQAGSFNSSNITDFQWQWRGQTYTQDVLGLLSQWKRLLPTPYENTLAVVNAGAAPLQGVPYTIINGTLFGGGGPGGPSNAELLHLLFWSLVLSGMRCRLSSLQTAASDQTFNMTVSGGYSGTHKILGRYARSWQKNMRDMWVGQVMAGGAGSLAANCLGPNYGSAKLLQRGAAGKPYTTTDETRYLPWQLFPAAAAAGR